MPTPIRAFVAVELGPELRAGLEKLIADLRPAVSRARWVAPAGIHLTLRFLGATEAETLERLEPRLRRAAAECPAGTARVAGLGFFPERGAPRVLWVGIEVSEPILALQRACEGFAVAEGFAREERAFHPHLTLARFHDRVPRPNLPPVDLGTKPLERLVVYRSDLKPAGAVYTPLSVFPLGPAPA